MPERKTPRATARRPAAERKAAAVPEVPVELAVVPIPIPIPRALRHHAWFPASVVLPGEARRARYNVKVFATDAGLYVYDKPPADRRQVDRIDAAWWSPIDYDKTEQPRSDRMSRNSGIPIWTEAGLVTVTPQAGCGCGQRILKGWLPEWAATIHAWAQ